MHKRLLAALILSSATAVGLVISFVYAQVPPLAREGTESGKDGRVEEVPQRETGTAGVEFSRLPPLQQQIHLSALRGADWVRRANRTDGRFVHGIVPSLRTAIDGDNFLHQTGAALTLGRAARYFGDDRYAAVARQSLLTLLLDTSLDPDDNQVRRTTLPSFAINRLAAAGWLILAITELPAPAADLVAQAEELTRYIRKQQRTDGSLDYQDAAAQLRLDSAGANTYPGPALCALLQSHKLKPASWKLDIIAKALPYYRNWWRGHKSTQFIATQTAAYAQAYALTKQAGYAEFVFEINDWLCGQQHNQIDPRHPLWLGGFTEWEENTPLAAAPRAASAALADSLVEASTVARLAGDTARYRRYRGAAELTMQFLMTLQYTDANTQHFSDWYRPTILGGFWLSHQDGNLRIDTAQQAICAMLKYLVSGKDSTVALR